MTIRKRILFIHLIWSMMIPKLIHSQAIDSRKTEEDVKIEDQFIAAKLLVTSGKKPEAIKLLDSLRRVTPPSASIHFELAKLYHSNRDINQAESNLKVAVQLEPDNIWLRKWEVSFARELGRNSEAVKTLQHLITLQPKDSETYDQIVQIYLKSEEYSKALQILELKEKNVGWSVGNTIMRAEILDASGKLNECIGTLKTITAKYPLEKKYYVLIVKILHANDKITESESYLKKILEIDPYDNDAKLGLLLLNKGKGTRDDYFASLMPLISNGDAPIDIKIKELMPYVQKHAVTADTILGNQLISVCDKLVIAHPGDAKSHAVYGDVLKNNGNYVAAIRQYEKTLSLNKKNYAVWEQLMFCQMFTQDFEALVATSSNAIDFFPNQAMSYYFASVALIAKNELKKAENTLAEASMIAAGNPDLDSRIMAATGQIYLLKKEFNKAKTYAEQAIQMSNGKNIEATELMGDIYIALEDGRNASIFYQKSYDLGNRSKLLLNKISSLKNN